MRTSTVRISKPAQDSLRELAAQTGESMQVVLERAIADYRRRHFWEQVNAEYAALRRDSQRWNDELDERSLFEGTLGDDIEGER